MHSGPRQSRPHGDPVEDFAIDGHLRVPEPAAAPLDALDESLRETTLETRAAVIRRERDLLRERVGELEAALATRDEQLRTAQRTIIAERRRREELLERYETILAAHRPGEAERPQQGPVARAIARIRRLLPRIYR